MSGSALLSDDRRYRYYLTRRWGPGLSVAWLMLNPSTADADTDDPTLRKVVGFTRAWGYNACAVVNLYGVRSALPAVLLDSGGGDPVGPDNDRWVEHFAGSAAMVVVAFGAHRAARPRAVELLPLLPDVGGLWCIGTNADGSPLHPCRAGYTKAPEPWTSPW